MPRGLLIYPPRWKMNNIWFKCRVLTLDLDSQRRWRSPTARQDLGWRDADSPNRRIVEAEAWMRERGPPNVKWETGRGANSQGSWESGPGAKASITWRRDRLMTCSLTTGVSRKCHQTVMTLERNYCWGAGQGEPDQGTGSVLGNRHQSAHDPIQDNGVGWFKRLLDFSAKSLVKVVSFTESRIMVVLCWNKEFLWTN